MCSFLQTTRALTSYHGPRLSQCRSAMPRVCRARPRASGSSPPSDPFPSRCDLRQLVPWSWDPLLPPPKLQAHTPPQQVTHHLQHASAMSHTYNPLTRMCTRHSPTGTHTVSPGHTPSTTCVSHVTHIQPSHTHVHTSLPCEHTSSHSLCNTGAVECSSHSRLSITTGPGSSEALKPGVQLNSCDYFPIRLPAWD